MKKILLALIVTANVFAAGATVGEGVKVDCGKISGIMTATTNVKTGTTLDGGSGDI